MKTILIAAIALLSFSAMAANSTAKSEYDTARKAAGRQYAEDKKLCGEETTSSARMQCLRDAKAEYSKALSSSKQAYDKALTTAASKSAATSTASDKVAASVCAECGKVSSVKVVEKKGESTPLGMIAGGVAGAVLGHQVGGGNGKKIATLAGAAGGAYAGHKVEENMRATKSWDVSVHFEDGSDRIFNFASDPGFATGDAVKLSGNSIARR